MRRVFRENGLSLAMFGMFVVFVAAQSVAGLLDYKTRRASTLTTRATAKERIPKMPRGRFGAGVLC